MEQTKELENYKKELKKVENKKIGEITLNYNDLGGESGVSSLSLEFPTLCFLISLKRELVTVHIKA